MRGMWRQRRTGLSMVSTAKRPCEACGGDEALVGPWYPQKNAHARHVAATEEFQVSKEILTKACLVMHGSTSLSVL